MIEPLLADRTGIPFRTHQRTGVDKLICRPPRIRSRVRAGEPGA
ncbi:MAG TPA: hypothetical protein VG253_20540 [Streptosporangiaceae bacterium]|nr:hypothetical protein [Streptosporangiaceae bacterium]